MGCDFATTPPRGFLIVKFVTILAIALALKAPMTAEKTNQN